MASYYITIGDKEHIVTFQNGKAAIDGSPFLYQLEQLDERSFVILIDGRSRRLVVARSAEGYDVLVDGKRVDVSVESERARLLKQFGGKRHAAHTRMDIHAPMPALVVRVEVEVGQDVKPGQGLMILEAMKMENELRAHAEARVKEIFVNKGQAVEKGELLMSLE
ncbi:MAG: hypothetical protein C4326_03295 [Ignavibacteria bacterium]